MKTINYGDGIKLAKHLSEELAKEGALKDHCKLHNINYQNVLMYIRSTAKLKKPGLVKAFLESLGYKTEVDKTIIYHFILNTDDDDQDVEIEKILLEMGQDPE